MSHPAATLRRFAALIACSVFALSAQADPPRTSGNGPSLDGFSASAQTGVLVNHPTYNGPQLDGLACWPRDDSRR